MRIDERDIAEYENVSDLAEAVRESVDGLARRLIAEIKSNVRLSDGFESMSDVGFVESREQSASYMKILIYIDQTFGTNYCPRIYAENKQLEFGFKKEVNYPKLLELVSGVHW